MSEAQASSQQAGSQVPAGGTGERRVFVNVAIAGLVVLFCAMVTIVWCYSWWRVPATASALLVVEGSKDLEGAVVAIDGPELAVPLRAAITPQSSYICRFPLPAGGYSIRIEHRGALIYENPLFKIDDYQYALLPLLRLQEGLKGKDAATQPAALK